MKVLLVHANYFSCLSQTYIILVFSLYGKKKRKIVMRLGAQSGSLWLIWGWKGKKLLNGP
jgi:hypothetical protein